MIYSVIDTLTAMGLLYLFFELDRKTRRGQAQVAEPRLIEFRMNHGT